MKAEVWTKNYGGAVGAKCIWRGDIQIAPHVGDHVVVSDGGTAEEVKEVYYHLYNQTIVIRISPDYDNEYPDLDKA